ncbi:hypothetical protein CEUSTIGMA_g1416.t1 [Chlamydomonas eustigma]|uniref:Aldehyde dehydrogenase domain-containing protein n=1 Tax=Chlamydomonas eustigma TaxID=1157962 RepID=A0A250WT89_9CHLO|nr:hypothetical protein CEUSTIGMA_g1416.t1 [Chlamydomonas eustigma]|eukprot:GAX73966.1 hypothetical protein CEUSTIGMA_g1416.t1 [Chlamydomonas eustigma]
MYIPHVHSNNRIVSGVSGSKSGPSKRVSHIVKFHSSLSSELTSAAQASATACHLPHKLLINGAWVDASDGETFPIIDPRNEQTILNAASASAVDVDKAVNAAREAFDEGPWPKMSAKERGRTLFKLADLMESHSEKLALLETLDNGKPLSVARAADVPLSVDHLRYYAGWADKIHGKTISVDGPAWAYTLHEPVGVVAQIIPWNFPLLMAMWKIAPALACGNTVILKVAEQTPLTALLLGQLALEAGIPPGVLNILTGFGPQAGAPLCSHRGVDKVAFTGSTEVGRYVGKMAAANLKPCTLELGGKSPIIVDKDVDIDDVVLKAHSGLFFNHGQCCAAGSRTFIHADIYDEFVEKAVAVAQKQKVGDPFTDVNLGPLIDAEQFNKVMNYIASGEVEGAVLRTGGRRLGSEGFYVEPTVFSDVSDNMSIGRDEIFGPVQCLMKFHSLEEVIRRANDTHYGLASGIFSNNVHTINKLTRAIRAGTVWVNCYNVYDAAVPFGGWKDSGIGVEKGEYALQNYTKVKAVYQRLEDPAWR